MEDYLHMLNIEHYMIRTYEIALGSNDPSTQNGAIIVSKDDGDWKVIGQGFNTFPYGVKESRERWERPIKYQFVEHAERNSIYSAAINGKRTLGAVMICPWAACADCARGIIQSGITALVRHYEIGQNSPDHWKESIAAADQMLVEAGVEIIEWGGKFENKPSPIRLNGELWTP